MTDISLDTLTTSAAPARRDIGLKKRYAAERRFRLYGVLAIAVGLVFLAIMLTSIVSKGYTAFWQATVTVQVEFDPKINSSADQGRTKSSWCSGAMAVLSPMVRSSSA